MNIKSWVSGALTAATVTFGSAAAYSQEAGGTLVMLLQPEPPSMASYLSTSGPIGLMAPKVYEGLLDYDKDLKAVPSLAKSWDVSDDGKTVTFKLQEGVTWQAIESYDKAIKLCDEKYKNNKPNQIIRK